MLMTIENMSEGKTQETGERFDYEWNMIVARRKVPSHVQIFRLLGEANNMVDIRTAAYKKKAHSRVI